jgi:hypothetical protein
MTRAEAERISGGLSKPSKMRCPGTSLEAVAACRVGSILRNVAGSTCSGCYADAERRKESSYARYPNVKRAQVRRLSGIRHPRWVAAMAKMIGRRKYFRWHDAGDVQDRQHLARIIKVARATPGTRHWLPTKEYALVRSLRRIPSNLAIRVSHPMLDQSYSFLFDGRFPTSAVSTLDEFATCPGSCDPCRACWDRNVSNVTYRRH